MDQMLKLIIEDVSVTRPEQISSRLNLGKEIVMPLLMEMEKSEHIQLIKCGSHQVYVIIVKSPGRQFYKSSSYAALNNETTEIREGEHKTFKFSTKALIWTLIATFLIILLIVGWTQGWFS